MNTLLKIPGFVLQTEAQTSLHARLQCHCANAYARFRQSWNQLVTDPYLRDGGSYRKRRYSVFLWRHGDLQCLPHEPHYQSSHHNKLHGGFNRHFRDWLPTTVNNPAFQRIVAWCLREIGSLPTQTWRIQAHQFRIEANHQQQGKPTPEGVHKDGADYILIMLLDRQNLSGGESRIYNNAMQPLAQHTLQQTGDLLLINDEQVYHGVSAVDIVDDAQAAWRDVLVLTFHRQ